MSTTTRTARPATDRQVTFINALATEVGDERALNLLMTTFSVISALDLNITQASAFIDVLKAEQGRQRSEQRVVREAEAVVVASTLEVGVYMRNGTPVRVYPSQRGHLLAKALIDGEWVYQGAAHRFVRADMRMTVDEANQYGLDFGICACCGRTLTATDSRYRGIGPVCWKKYF